MSKVKRQEKSAIPLSVIGSFEIVDLPKEKRKGVMKIVNPSSWSVAYLRLSKYRNKIVNIKFSTDVKRTGMAGSLSWHVNNSDYPVIGNYIENAKTDIWYKMSGEWTGEIVNSRMFYLNTWENNSSATTFYIDNFNIEVETKGNRIQKIPAALQKTLKDLAVYYKGVIPTDIPKTYTLKPVFKKIASEESIRKGVLAYRDFLYLICDGLIADGHLYYKPVKNANSHSNLTERFPLFSNIINILFKIGYYGKSTDNNNSLILKDPQLLSDSISNTTAGNGSGKLTNKSVIEALRFLENCGFCFDGIELDNPKPTLSKNATLEVTYPDNPSLLIGLKAMVLAQKEFRVNGNHDIFMRCDYRVLIALEPEVTILLKDFVHALPVKIQDFVLKLHEYCLEKGLIFKSTFTGINLQFHYFCKNKEVCSFFASPISGYRLLIKAQNTQKYSDVIQKFSLPLQEKIAKGYGCNMKKFDEPCQNGCHGFSFSLDDGVLKISKDILIWINSELA